jgi:hypothetical protein
VWFVTFVSRLIVSHGAALAGVGVGAGLCGAIVLSPANVVRFLELPLRVPTHVRSSPETTEAGSSGLRRPTPEPASSTHHVQDKQ